MQAMLKDSNYRCDSQKMPLDTKLKASQLEVQSLRDEVARLRKGGATNDWNNQYDYYAYER